MTALGEQRTLFMAVLSLSSMYWWQLPLNAVLLSCCTNFKQQGVNNSFNMHFNVYILLEWSRGLLLKDGV